MGLKRVVDVQFWNDDKVLEYFSPEDKLFMVYLLTNPHTTQLGIYAINKKHMSFELGYTIDVIDVLLERFENKYKMIKYSNETKEIAIKNYLKHSIVKGGAPVRDCLIKELNQVRDKSLIEYVFGNIKGDNLLNITVQNLIDEYEKENGELIYSNKNKNDNDNENDNENDNDNEVSLYDTINESYKKIIGRLNKLTGANYKYTTKGTQSLINGRLRDGYTEEDLIMVVEKMCYLWGKPKKGEKDMREYLRPSTLFAPTNFENYYNKPVKIMTTNDVPVDISDF